MTAGPDDADDQRPLELLGVLDLSEVDPAPGTRHTEILTRAGKLGLIWDGDPGDDGRVLVTCAGAFGGFLGPAGGLYFDLARTLAAAGVTTVRVDYRQPNHLPACILDVAVAVDLAERCGGTRFVVVGHSFGGAVAIAAGAAMPEHVVAIVTLATQSAGCEPAADLGGRPLLLVHGDADAVIPASSSAHVQRIAGHGEVVVLPGAGHLLTEVADDLRGRLAAWILSAFDGGPEPF
jgi:pimeloyl-ACP methyl ester carboxylesterase